MESGGFNFTGFLFGNIDLKTGNLDNDVLDEDAKRQLGALGSLGLGSLVTQVMQEVDQCGKRGGTDDLSQTTPRNKVKVVYDVESASDEVDSSEEEHSDISRKTCRYRTVISPSDFVPPSRCSSEGSVEEDYDEVIKSPSAVDFSDICELAEESKEPKFGTGNSVGRLTSTLTSSSSPLAYPKRGALHVGTDISALFAGFSSGTRIQFCKLLDKVRASRQPNIWKGVNKRRRKLKKMITANNAREDPTQPSILSQVRSVPVVAPLRSWRFEDGVPKAFPNSGNLTKEEKRNYKELDALWNTPKNVKENENHVWRHGPAKLWYDMLGIPDDGVLNFGIEADSTEPCGSKQEHHSRVSSVSISEDEPLEEPEEPDTVNCTSDVPVEAFHMVTQHEWEKDVIWDGNAIRLTKGQAMRPPSWTNPSKAIQAPISSTVTEGAPTFKKLIQYNVRFEAGANSQDDTWCSDLPVENPNLVYGDWESDVIWDVKQLTGNLEPKALILDPSDDRIVLNMPKEINPKMTAQLDQEISPRVKAKIPYLKKSKSILRKVGMIDGMEEEESPPPTPTACVKDPYNISNDEFYQPKTITFSSIFQHSIPVVELMPPFMPTHFNTEELRNFHRPPLQQFSTGPLSLPGPHPILPLTKHIQKKARLRELERIASGGGNVFFMRTPDDLSGKDGEVLMIEYSEEHPPLLSQVGMCSEIRNYYKRKSTTDTGPPPLKYGKTVLAPAFPFLGAMRPGEQLSTLENNLYRSPIYNHPTPMTDFLIIRDRNGYYIRNMDALYTAGQECPLLEVPSPKSKKSKKFERDILQAFVYRLFWKSEHSETSPRKTTMDALRRAFPAHNETTLRKRLTHCANFKRCGENAHSWVMKTEFRLPSVEEIRMMISPEDYCTYLSLIAAEQRLKDAGYGDKCLFTPEDDSNINKQQEKMDEVKAAPWNTTRAFIEASNGKCLLQLTGPADPTGCGEGFSYVQMSHKPQSSKEQQVARTKRIVGGTDADLRRLSLNNAKSVLKKYGIPDEEIRKLSRWEIVDLVRTASNEKAKLGETGMAKFSRWTTSSMAENIEKNREECQRIFDLQNRVLSSSEVLSTDEEDSDEEDEEVSDIDEMGRTIEDMLTFKKTSSQFIHDQEEEERLALKKMLMGERKTDEDEKSKSSRKQKGDEKESTNALTALESYSGRVLQIHRTYKDSDGNDYTRTEVIRDPAVMDIYLKIRTTKDEAFISQLALDEEAKEEIKRQKRKIQEQLRRIRKNEEKEKAVLPPEKKTPKKTPLPRFRPDVKIICGACGQVGHMRTNKDCPFYKGQMRSLTASPITLAVVEEEDGVVEKQGTNEEEHQVTATVDGMKLRIAGKLVTQEEEEPREPLVLRLPKNVNSPGPSSPIGLVRKRRTSQMSEPERCAAPIKKRRTSNRFRIDPEVVISGIFESILNSIRDMSEAEPFHYPVNTRLVPHYNVLVKNPMDLQTMREKIRFKKYHLRSEFLADVHQIRNNSCLFNGENAYYTLAAGKLVEQAITKVNEQAEEFDRLEKMINPMLDQGQLALNYILEGCIDKLKSMPEAYPFIQPVNARKVKNYYLVIKNPMDFETMAGKIKGNLYLSHKEFIADINLIYSNAVEFNGPNSPFATQGLLMVNSATAFLSGVQDHLAQIEQNISQENRYPKKGSVEGYQSDGWDSNSNTSDMADVKVERVIRDKDLSQMKNYNYRDRAPSVMTDYETVKLEEGGQFHSVYEESRHNREEGRSGLADRREKEAVQAMLMLSNYQCTTDCTDSINAPSSSHPPQDFTSSGLLPVIHEQENPMTIVTPVKIDEDLALSDSDNENNHNNIQQPSPASRIQDVQTSASSNKDEDDFIWF